MWQRGNQCHRGFPAMISKNVQHPYRSKHIAGSRKMEKLWMCKIIEYSLNTHARYCLEDPPSLSDSLEACPFLVFKDFTTLQRHTLTHGKLRTMQMIPVHKKANEFFPVWKSKRIFSCVCRAEGAGTDIHPVEKAVFVSSSKFKSAFLITYMHNWTLALPLN